MDPQPAFGFKELLTHIVSDMARAVCERMGETQQHQFTRTQATAHMIMGFLPRDAIEAILAGHCVMFHEMMTDSIHDTLRGEMDSYRRATRANIVALDKCFGNNLERLERYQARPAQGRRDEPDALPVDTLGDVEVPARPEPQPPSRAARKPAPATPTQPRAEAVFRPSPEAIAACRANPEAMAALEAGDHAAFARAMGIEPSKAYLAAVAGTDGGESQIVRMVRDNANGSGAG
jgi:hypothetical protein